MELLWALHQCPHMQLFIMVFMKKNFSQDTHNASYFIISLLTMLLVPGAQTETHDMMQWNGTLSRTK